MHHSHADTVTIRTNKSNGLELLHYVSRSKLVSEVLEILPGDDRGRSVNERVQTDVVGVHEPFVDDDLHLVVGIVDLGEEGEVSLLDAEHALQQLAVSEAEGAALVFEFLRLTASAAATLVSFLMSTAVSKAATTIHSPVSASPLGFLA